MHLHDFDLKAIASLPSHGLDAAIQRRVDRLLAIESEGGRPDGAGHEEEGPARSGEFLFELLRSEGVVDP